MGKFKYTCEGKCLACAMASREIESLKDEIKEAHKYIKEMAEGYKQTIAELKQELKTVSDYSVERDKEIEGLKDMVLRFDNWFRANGYDIEEELGIK